jgi:hypothetical protein
MCSEMTAKSVRRLLESDLGLPKAGLDSFKADISDMLDKVHASSSLDSSVPVEALPTCSVMIFVCYLDSRSPVRCAMHGPAIGSFWTLVCSLIRAASVARCDGTTCILQAQGAVEV